MKNVNFLITELVCYAQKNGLMDPLDHVYTVNRLCEILGVTEYVAPLASDLEENRELHLILEDLLDFCGADTNAQKDLLDTKIMGVLTPPPSAVIRRFNELYEQSSKEATNWYYSFSKATNYIRTDRIARDEKWLTKTSYGDMDITINLSKPEKDPRDIIAAGKAKSTSYPKCLLCVENEGYAGTISHPARQNHRIIPINLQGDSYYLQYSPYVYYNEHCIILNENHVPMAINKSTFAKLLDFVKLFPHYTAGSNADLPIVGGSILSHDHFQGGCYSFPMARAPYEKMFSIKGFEDVTAGIVKWPMSLIRLTGKDTEQIVNCADYILNSWRNYTDEEAFIFSSTNGVPHNTITPIARMNDEGLFELDLVLRNNITTDEHPMGVYHPHKEYHHIKKENIGLIEVMGLAILPARLKGEMALMEDAILQGKNIADIDAVASHADWVNSWLPEYEVTKENIHSIMQDETGKVFAKILECAGVFKRDEEGRKAFDRFINAL